MEKIQSVFLVIIVVSLSAILLIQPSKAVSQKQFIMTNPVPDDVKEILKNSCSSCHDLGGKEFAMMAWNLSEWDTYSIKKQARKAKAMCNAITSGKMPPSSESKATPGKVPTAAQLQTICNWATLLKKK